MTEFLKGLVEGQKYQSPNHESSGHRACLQLELSHVNNPVCDRHGRVLQAYPGVGPWQFGF